MDGGNIDNGVVLTQLALADHVGALGGRLSSA